MILKMTADMASSSDTGDQSTASRAMRPLAAGLALGSATSASAVIIYSDTAIVYEGTPVYDGGGTVAPSSFQSFSVGADDNFKLYAGPDMEDSSTFKVSLRAANGGAFTSEASLYDVIGSGSSFVSGGSTADVGLGQHYFGLSINSGEMYGWVSMLNSGDGVGSVEAWAYEDNGGSIAVGAVPEPATTAAVVALLAGSAAIWQRRRQKLASA